MITFSVFSNQDTSTKQLSFAMFAPRYDFFWPLQEAFMKDACNDLHIQCQVYYSDDNQYEMKRQIESVTTGENKVDAILFHNYKQQGKTFIQIAEKNGVASFLINTPLSNNDYKIMGKPREKYKMWLGESVPNDQYAGYLTAKEIINAASKSDRQSPDGKIGMIAINGIISDGATIERKIGLQKAINERDDITLYQYFTTRNWSDEEAISKYIGALNRYPNILAVWAGDDNLAIAILQAAQKHNLTAGKDFFIAGIGWSDAGLNAVENGTFVVDIGGHFLEAAWATFYCMTIFMESTFRMKDCR